MRLLNSFASPPKHRYLSTISQFLSATRSFFFCPFRTSQILPGFVMFGFSPFLKPVSSTIYQNTDFMSNFTSFIFPRIFFHFENDILKTDFYFVLFFFGQGSHHHSWVNWTLSHEQLWPQLVAKNKADFSRPTPTVFIEQKSDRNYVIIFIFLFLFLFKF